MALGTFDGVHAGHQAVLDAAIQIARANGLSSVALSFLNHPLSVILQGVGAPRLLTPASEKVQRLCQTGIDAALLLPFDQALRKLPAEEFLALLVQHFSAKHIVIGQDHRFGCGRKGGADTIASMLQGLGCQAHIVPPVEMDGRKISSTDIRTQLQAGDIALANLLLGYSYTLQGRINHGQGLGRKLGFPTINLQLPGEKLLPRFGVYGAIAAIAKRRYQAVVNVGIRPTVGGDSPVVEAFLLNFDGDLYGQSASLALQHFLRPEQRFDSLQALQAQVFKDIETAQRQLDLPF